MTARLWILLGLAGASAFFSFAEKGGVGVGAATLIEFMQVSPLSRIVFLLYGLPLAGALLLLLGKPGRWQGTGYALLALGCLGVVATFLSISEAMSHIDLFGKACRSVPELATAIGASRPSWGGIIGLIAYGVLVTEGIRLAGDRGFDHQTTGLQADMAEPNFSGER